MRRRHRGVSLIEVLVAIVLLAGGVLALLSTSRTLAAHRHALLARRAALLAAAARGDALRSESCAAATGGSAPGRGHHARWTLSGATTRQRREEITLLDAATAWQLHELLPCAP